MLMPGGLQPCQVQQSHLHKNLDPGFTPALSTAADPSRSCSSYRGQDPAFVEYLGKKKAQGYVEVESSGFVWTSRDCGKM